MKKKLILATTNTGKVDEFLHIISYFPKLKELINVETLSKYDSKDIEETGSTFIQNAEIKSKTAYELLNNMNVINDQTYILGDDSGLVIPELDNMPGLYSARFATLIDGTRNFDYAFSKIENMIISKFGFIKKLEAYFVCALSMTFLNKGEIMIKTLEHKVYGTLTFPKRGINEFGYDPIFIPNGFNITFAEMDTDVKNKHSHRFLCFEQLVNDVFLT